MKLVLLPGRLVVCRLSPHESLPAWATGGALVSITRTADELSIVCAEEQVPTGVQQEPSWRAFRVPGPLPFALTGVLASLLEPLARAGVGIFAVSTYDTDYILVKQDRLNAAVAAWRDAGHEVRLG